VSHLPLEELSDVAGVLIDLLDGLGLAIFSGKPVRFRWVVAGLITAGISGFALWTQFTRFFNTAPGWAIAAGALWGLFLLVAISMTVASVRAAVTRPPS
jgi:hypothetical protein